MLFDLLDPHMLAALVYPLLDERSVVELAATCRAGWELARAECCRRGVARDIVVRHNARWNRLDAGIGFAAQLPAYAAPHEASCPGALTCSSTRVVTLARDGFVTVWQRRTGATVATAPGPPLFAFHAQPLLPPPTVDRTGSTYKRPKLELAPAVSGGDTGGGSAVLKSRFEYPALFADDVRVVVGGYGHGAALLYRYADLPAAAAAGAADRRVALQPSMTFFGPPHRPGVATICCGEPDLVVAFVDGSVAVFDLYTGIKRGEYVPPPGGPRYGVPRCAQLGESGHLVVGTDTGHVLVYNTHAFDDPGSASASAAGSKAPLGAVASVVGEHGPPFLFAQQADPSFASSTTAVVALQWSAGVSHPGSTCQRTVAGGLSPFFGGRSAALVQPPLTDNRVFLLDSAGAVFAATLEQLLSHAPGKHTCTACSGPGMSPAEAEEVVWAVPTVEACGRMIFRVTRRSAVTDLGVGCAMLRPHDRVMRFTRFFRRVAGDARRDYELAGPVLPLSPFASPGHACLVATAAGAVMWCTPLPRSQR
jgi:hypothetical protein